MITDIKLLSETRTQLGRKYRLKSVKLFWTLLVANLFFYTTIIVVCGTLASFSLAALVILSPVLIIVAFFYINKIIPLRRNLSLLLLAAKACKQRFGEEVLAKNEPYAVFLRGFENEISRMTDELEDSDDQLFGDEIDSLNVRVFFSYVEVLITKYLNKQITLLALSDPRSDLPLPGAHRFLTKPDDWQEFILNLLPSAKVIFVYVTGLSPGLLVELKMLISNPEWAKKTVVIVSEVYTRYNHTYKRQMFQKQFPFKFVIFERSSPQGSDHAIEKAFQRLLKQSLIDLEAENYSAGALVDANSKGYYLKTPIPFVRVIRFIKGPFIWVSVAYIIIRSFHFVTAHINPWTYIDDDLEVFFLIFIVFVAVKYFLVRQKP